MAIHPYLLEKFTLKPLIYRFLIKEEKGMENLSTDTPYIFAPNHNSHIDEFVVMPPIYLGTERKTHFFADRKHWFEGKLYFRLLAKRFEAIPVDRGRGTADDALRRGVEKIKMGHNVIIYPEGTRGSCFDVAKGKVGVAKLALWSRAPVVPMGIWGTHLIMPKGVHKPNIKRVVKINIGKPMTFEEFYDRDDDPSVLRTITDSIMEEIAKLVGQECSAI
jgi:1-acyl-sn-glycerol-3-phosphate acyltransferase